MLIKDNKIIPTDSFTKEKELQNFFEKNLSEILGYEFIETEFAVDNFRIDTFAYDPENKSFRIIEYKNNKNYSLVDQGYTYLKVLFQSKADFVLRYNRKTGRNIDVPDIDWSQSRVVFVSTDYTSYQLNASDYYDAPYDLIKVTKYQDNIVDVDFIKHTSSVSVKEIATSDKAKKHSVDREIKVYTELDHLRNTPDNIKELYVIFKERVLELGDIDVEPQKLYVAFKGSRNICDVEIQQRQLKIYANLQFPEVEDLQNPLARNMTGIGHWGNGDCEMIIKTQDDIDGIMPIIRRSFEKNKK